MLYVMCLKKRKNRLSKKSCDEVHFISLFLVENISYMSNKKRILSNVYILYVYCTKRCLEIPKIRKCLVIIHEEPIRRGRTFLSPIFVNFGFVINSRKINTSYFAKRLKYMFQLKNELFCNCCRFFIFH